MKPASNLGDLINDSLGSVKQQSTKKEVFFFSYHLHLKQSCFRRISISNNLVLQLQNFQIKLSHFPNIYLCFFLLISIYSQIISISNLCFIILLLVVAETWLRITTMPLNLSTKATTRPKCRLHPNKLVLYLSTLQNFAKSYRQGEDRRRCSNVQCICNNS